MNCVDKFLRTVHESTGKRVSAKGIIVLDKSKILVLRIQTGCHAEGKWDLPGGGLEKDEDPIDALKREVKEETNLDLDEDSIKSLNQSTNFDIPEDGVHAKWKYYIADAKNGNVVLNPAKWLNGRPEHSEYKWLDNLTDAEQIDICDEHRKIIINQLRKLINHSNKF